MPKITCNDDKRWQRTRRKVRDNNQRFGIIPPTTTTTTGSRKLEWKRKSEVVKLEQIAHGLRTGSVFVFHQGLFSSSLFRKNTERKLHCVHNNKHSFLLEKPFKNFVQPLTLRTTSNKVNKTIYPLGACGEQNYGEKDELLRDIIVLDICLDSNGSARLTTEERMHYNAKVVEKRFKRIPSSCDRAICIGSLAVYKQECECILEGCY